MRHYLLSFTCLFLALKGAALDCLPVSGQTHDRLAASATPSKGSQDEDAAYPGTTPLHGIGTGDSAPSDSASGVSSAPGADAMMTQDLLLVNPNKSGAAPKPLQSFVGDSLKLSIDSKSIVFHGLRGLMITVSNDTNRPLLIDGDNAKATLGAQAISAISVSVLQKSVLPSKSLKATAVRTTIQVVPAAATVGLTLTVEDYIKMKKPVRKRYGSDSQRRQAEASRFGKRIVWPHQKTEGILYFKTAEELTGSKVEIPVHTLFDAPDHAVISATF